MRSANPTAQPRPNPWVTVVLAVVVTLLAGCVGDDEEADPPGSTGGDPAETTVSSTTAAATTPEEEVEAAYMAFNEMLDRLITTSNDPDDPEIAQRTVEPMLTTVRNNVATNRAEGRRWIIGDRSSHDVNSVEVLGADEAVVTDCVVTDDQLVDIATGEVLDQGASTTLWRFTMKRDGDAWKVAFYDPPQSWEGVVECAA